MQTAAENHSAPDPLLGSSMGHYRLIRKIGEGGMGAVYEAVHVDNGRRAAVKVLLRELLASGDAASRFFNEAKAVSTVTHSSLVAIYEHGQSSTGEPYIAMEFLDGESLRARHDQRYLGHSSLLYVRQLAAALAATHKKRIIHREP